MKEKPYFSINNNDFLLEDSVLASSIIPQLYGIIKIFQEELQKIKRIKE